MFNLTGFKMEAEMVPDLFNVLFIINDADFKFN